jgi:D-alanyl-D-alanine carboxypeptidase
MQGSLIKWLKPKRNVQLQMKLKSGSMERVRSYTGFLVHDEHPVYAMSLLVNHYSCSGDKINELIAHFLNHIQNNR